MRSILSHVAAGVLAAGGFLFILYAFGSSAPNGQGTATLLLAAALFFLSTVIVMARVLKARQPRHVRVRDRSRR